MSTTKWFSRFFQSRFAPVSQFAAKLFPFSVLLCLALSSASATPTITHVIGYWDGNTSTVSNLDATKLTHLIYSFASVGQGTCAISNASTLGTQFQSFKAANPKLKILISVGGAGSDVASAFSTAAQNAESFANNCVYALLPSFQTGLIDGIDIDWEYPASDTDKANYTNLMQAFRTQLNQYQQAWLPKQSLLLTVAIGPEEGTTFPQGWHYIDLPTVQNSVDFVNLMTYDYAGDWNESSGAYPNAPLASIRSDLFGTDGIVKAGGLSANKIALGIPFYGVTWKNASYTSNPPQPSNLPGYIGRISGDKPTYAQITSALQKDASSVTYDHDTDGNAYGYDSSTQTLYQYDDATTIQNKVQYIQDSNLFGAMIWNLSQDTSGETLLNAIAGYMPAPCAPPVCVVAPPPGHGPLIPPDRSTYNFESGTQGWTIYNSSVASIETSTSLHYLGAHSLAVVFNSSVDTPTVQTPAPQGIVYVPVQNLQAGGTVTLHVYTPGVSGLSSVQAFISDSNYNWTVDPHVTAFTPGGWTTFTITVPANAIEIGVCFDSSSEWNGVAFIDSVNYQP